MAAMFALRDRLAKAFQRCLTIKTTDAAMLQDEEEFLRQTITYWTNQSLDRLTDLLHAAIAHVVRYEDDPTSICITLLLLAKQQPEMFDQERVVAVLVSLFRPNFPWPNASRSSLVLPIAARLLMAGLASRQSWPLELVAVYLDDALGNRLWVDNSKLSIFTQQIETAFIPSVESNVASQSKPSDQVTPGSPKNEMTAHATARFVNRDKEVAALCAEAVAQIKPASLNIANVAKTVPHFRHMSAVCEAIARQLQLWLPVAAASAEQLRNLLDVMDAVLCGGDRSAIRTMLMLKMPSSSIIQEAMTDIINLFARAHAMEASHDAQQLLQRAHKALQREFEGKAALQDTAAIKVGFELPGGDLLKAAGQLLHSILAAAPDPRSKLRSCIRRLAKIDSFDPFELCKEVLRCSRAYDVKQFAQGRLPQYMTFLIEVYSHLLIVFVRTPLEADEILRFTTACDRPFVMPENSDTPTAAVPASETVIRTKNRLAQAQEAVLLWLQHMLTTELRTAPGGYITYQLRRIFFLGDPKMFLNRSISELPPLEAAGFLAVARHPLLGSHVLSLLLDWTRRGAEFPTTDAVEIIASVINNAVPFHIHMQEPLHVHRPEELLERMLSSTKYAVAGNVNVMLPPNYVPPQLVVAHPYHRALVAIFSLSACNTDMLRIGWEKCFALRQMMMQCVTRTYAPASVAAMTSQEMDQILEYEQFLAASFGEAPPTRSTSKLLGKVELVNPDIIHNLRPLAPMTIRAMQDVDAHVNMQATLIRCTNPDILQHVLAELQRQAQATGQRADLGWLANILSSRKSIAQRIPSDVLSQLLMKASHQQDTGVLISQFTASLQTTSSENMYQMVTDMLPKLSHSSAQARKSARVVILGVMSHEKAMTEEFSEISDEQARSDLQAQAFSALFEWFSANGGQSHVARDWLISGAMYEPNNETATVYLMGILQAACNGVLSQRESLDKMAPALLLRPAILTNLLKSELVGQLLTAPSLLEAIQAQLSDYTSTSISTKEVASSSLAAHNSMQTDMSIDSSRSEEASAERKCAHSHACCLWAGLSALSSTEWPCVAVFLQWLSSSITKLFGSIEQAIRTIQPYNEYQRLLKAHHFLPAIPSLHHFALWVRTSTVSNAEAFLDSCPVSLLATIILSSNASKATIKAAARLLTQRLESRAAIRDVLLAHMPRVLRSRVLTQLRENAETALNEADGSAIFLEAVADACGGAAPLRARAQVSDTPASSERRVPQPSIPQTAEGACSTHVFRQLFQQILFGGQSQGQDDQEALPSVFDLGGLARLLQGINRIRQHEQLLAVVETWSETIRESVSVKSQLMSITTKRHCAAIMNLLASKARAIGDQYLRGRMSEMIARCRNLLSTKTAASSTNASSTPPWLQDNLQATPLMLTAPDIAWLLVSEQHAVDGMRCLNQRSFAIAEATLIETDQLYKLLVLCLTAGVKSSSLYMGFAHALRTAILISPQVGTTRSSVVLATRLFHEVQGARDFALCWISDILHYVGVKNLSEQELEGILDILLSKAAQARTQLSDLLRRTSFYEKSMIFRHICHRLLQRVATEDQGLAVVDTWDAPTTQDVLHTICTNWSSHIIDMCTSSESTVSIYAINRTTQQRTEERWCTPQQLALCFVYIHIWWRCGTSVDTWTGHRNVIIDTELQRCVRLVLYALGVTNTHVEHKTAAMPCAGAMPLSDANIAALDETISIILGWNAASWPTQIVRQQINTAKLQVCATLAGMCRRSYAAIQAHVEQQSLENEQGSVLMGKTRLDATIYHLARCLLERGSRKPRSSRRQSLASPCFPHSAGKVQLESAVKPEPTTDVGLPLTGLAANLADSNSKQSSGAAQEGLHTTVLRQGDAQALGQDQHLHQGEGGAGEIRREPQVSLTLAESQPPSAGRTTLAPRNALLPTPIMTPGSAQGPLLPPPLPHSFDDDLEEGSVEQHALEDGTASFAALHIASMQAPESSLPPDVLALGYSSLAELAAFAPPDETDDMVCDDLERGAWLLLLNPDPSQLAAMCLISVASRHPMAVCAVLADMSCMLGGLLHFTAQEMVRRRYHTLFVDVARVVAAVARHAPLSMWQSVDVEAILDPFVDVAVHHSASAEPQLQAAIVALLKQLLDIGSTLPQAPRMLVHHLSQLQQFADIVCDAAINHLLLELERLQGLLGNNTPALFQPHVPKLGRDWLALCENLRQAFRPSTVSLESSQLDAVYARLLVICHKARQHPSSLRDIHDIIVLCMSCERKDIRELAFFLATVCVMDHPFDCSQLVDASCTLLMESSNLGVVDSALEAVHVLYCCSPEEGSRILDSLLDRCSREPRVQLAHAAPHLFATISLHLI
eukprot:m.210876 g.210876  ORF g.210876 m.210876 type:complete len:2339 (+) comp16941_c0_seq1:202-7218(+)